MGDLNSRIENLSPEKRRLLALLSKKKGAAAAKDEPRNDTGEDSLPESSAPASAATDLNHPTLTEELLTPGSEEAAPQKDTIRNFYDSVNRQLNESEFGEHSIFLNYGYVPNDNPSYAVVTPEFTLHKNSVRLVLELIGDAVLTPQSSLLDVGCGRGGTIATIRRFFKLGKIMGVDLTPQAIEFCKRTHRVPETSFMEGDAENLAFDDNSFDFVTNVESSHCYGDILKFYREVFRVLKPSGHFLYTDLMSKEKADTYPEKLAEIGFKVLRRVDITGNVLLSCDEVAATHYRAYGRDNDQSVIQNFLAMPESPVYNDMKSGKTKYLIFKIFRP